MLIEFIRNTKWRGNLMEIGHIVEIPDKEAEVFISYKQAVKTDTKPKTIKLENKAHGLEEKDKAAMFTRKTPFAKKVK